MNIAQIICAALLLLVVSTHPVNALTTGNPNRPQAVHRIIPEISNLKTREAQQAACVALAVYHEARGLEQKAQFAVAHVVLNRTKDDRFPSTPCAVVWQQHVDKTTNRRVGQFSWTTSKRNAVPYETEAWETAQRVAYLVTQDREITDPTRGATHFHEGKAKPIWRMVGRDKVTLSGHVFMKLPAR